MAEKMNAEEFAEALAERKGQECKQWLPEVVGNQQEALENIMDIRRGRQRRAERRPGLDELERKRNPHSR